MKKNSLFLLITVFLFPCCSDPIMVCGNGIFEPENYEECDDGLENGKNKACTHECKIAVCGDGLVFAGDEECDRDSDWCVDCTVVQHDE